MQILQAIILGIIQGITEFIPVSSSGHLLLAEKFFNLQVGSLLFDVMLHTGTLIALIIYFWKDLTAMAKSMLKPSGNPLWMWIIIATAPAVIIGILLQPLAEGGFRSAGVVAFNLFWVGILMLAADKVQTRRELKDMNGRRALAIGVAQSLALIPGVSRSGITIVGAVAQRFNREAAARFAFLLAIPITFGAIIKLLLDGGGIVVTNNLGVFGAGIAAAAISGYWAIGWLLKYLATHKLAAFAYYRIALAAAIVLVSLVA